MLWTILKWGVPFLAIIAVAGAFTRKTFHVETVIAAPPEEVWAVLMDTSAYPDWNPVFVEVQGAYVEDAEMLNMVRDPSGKILKMTATVATLAPARELRQKGGIPGILTFDHQWMLQPVEGGTRVVQHETDQGIGLWFWNSDWIEGAYSRVGDALGARVVAGSK